MAIIQIDTSPLNTGHSIRGIGTYTRLLVDALQTQTQFTIQLTGESKSLSKPDLIHYPFFDLFNASIPLIKRAKRVVTIHDVIPLLFPKYYPVGRRGKLALYRQKLMLNTVDAVITDSAVSKQDIIRELSVPDHKITVVPLAANPALEAVDASQIKLVRKQFNLPKEYVLYVGDINYNKNVPQLIKAMKSLPESLDLVLVGKNFYPHDIPEWRWIEAQIALSNVVNRIHFITTVASDDTLTMSSLYSGAICYVQPSLYEGFGLPVLEAMRCNVPVIASNRGSLPEVGGGTITLTEPTAESFSTAIAEILDWSDTHLEQSLRKQRIWLKHFSWQETALQTAAVYAKVLSIKNL